MDLITEYRKVQKSRRDKHIYNHYLGRKGYAHFEQDILQAEGAIGRVDRSVLWKKACEKKGKFNKITEPVINMIDELLENAKEIGLPPPGPNDILGQALGKPDHLGRVPDARIPFPNPYGIINVGDAMALSLTGQQALSYLKLNILRALRISAKKTSKREPSWQLVQCPRQEGGFECGYFVMRFIKEIIFYPTIIASKVLQI
ncbi:hypothetical protein CK203_026509 [Vitis vinifera]|uniref:Ubiquitin-like protease family profile domain-containing protein n=1 Tax=Vitis vinifera TaxID=29760 RepID=A0A438IVU6_VITVI|nr:hypothetical protein CK203_026509 [Vitis vinifera]